MIGSWNVPHEKEPIMFARVNRFQDDPANLDESERVAETEVVPQLKTIPGFQGVLSLVDRTSGESLAITFWETEEAMRASESDADRLREEIRDSTGSQVRTVERYELALRVGI
jgi:heme-degrading monooxygenase HmoA